MERIENAEYVHAKQACYLCLNNHDCVSTDIQIEGEGILAICRSCIADLARTAGFDLDDRQAYIESLESDLGAEKAAADEAEAVLTGLVKAADKIKANRQQLADAREAKAAKLAAEKAESEAVSA